MKNINLEVTKSSNTYTFTLTNIDSSDSQFGWLEIIFFQSGRAKIRLLFDQKILLNLYSLNANFIF